MNGGENRFEGNMTLCHNLRGRRGDTAEVGYAMETGDQLKMGYAYEGGDQGAMKKRGTIGLEKCRTGSVGLLKLKVIKLMMRALLVCE